ncbi:MAG: MFS transporter [Caulobacteraceae bacterium]
MSDVAAATADAADGADIADDGALVAPVSSLYRNYVLWLLLLVYVVNFLDRQVINILAPDIKRDLNLSNTEVGLLSGFAFGIVYTILGFPLARAADKYNRSWIISGCLAAWSGFTAVCGLAQNFVQLAAARAGVGIGEAGCTPTSHALIADYSPKEKRASALAFYAMGTPIGSLLGLAIGGYLVEAFNWRIAFMVAAAPGLLLAVICLFTLREPRDMFAAEAKRLAANAAAAAQSATATFGETFKYLRGKQAFWLLAFGAGIRSFLGYGHAPFTAIFFLDSHGPEITALANNFGMGPKTFLGLTMGILGGISGAAGSWLGGQIADRLGKKDLRAYGSVPAIATLIAAPVSIFIYLTDSGLAALLLGIVPGLLGTLWYGPVYSSAQGMVPQHMRATSASLMLFVINFLGLVMGALCIGALSDIIEAVFHLSESEAMRWTLVWSTAGGMISVLLFWLARRRVREDMVS